MGSTVGWRHDSEKLKPFRVPFTQFICNSFKGAKGAIQSFGVQFIEENFDENLVVRMVYVYSTEN